MQIASGERRSGVQPGSRARPCAYAIALLALIPALALPPAAAHARTASLTSVTEVDRHVVATWTMPKGVVGRFIEIAKFSPELSPNGHFRQRNITAFSVLDEQQTSIVVDDFTLSDGTYYVHIGTEDTFNREVCPGREFSNILRLDVPGGGTDAGIGGPGCVPVTGGGGGGSGGGGGGGQGGDNTAPNTSISFKRKQDVDKVLFTAKTDEAATVNAQATVRLAGKRYRFITVSSQVGANVTTKLRLRLNKRDLKVVKRALRRGRRLKAKVTISAIDPFFNTYVARRTIKLKP